MDDIMALGLLYDALPATLKYDDMTATQRMYDTHNTSQCHEFLGEMALNM